MGGWAEPGLEGLEQEPQGNWASPSMTAVSIFVGGMARAQGLEDALLSWLHFLPTVCMCLVRGWVEAQVFRVQF